MKLIWSKIYSYSGKNYTISIYDFSGSLRILATNQHGKPVLIKDKDENGNEAYVQISGTLDWITQEDLKFNGEDPENWLFSIVNRMDELIKYAINKNESPNL